MKPKHCFALGALVVGAMAAMAIETIPLTFQEGQIISAGTMNAVFARVNMITRTPIQSDLTGSWDCTETVPNAIGSTYVGSNRYGILATRKNTLVFGAADVQGVMALTATYAPFEHESSPGPGIPSSIPTFDLAAMTPGSRLLMMGQQTSSVWQALTISYLDKDRLEAYATSTPMIGGTGSGVLNCIKTNAPPAPADALTALVSGAVVNLMWVDQSGTETGFRIEQKTSADGAWSTAATAPANATESNITVLPGTYWFRVVAFNAVGDAMASGETQVTVSP